MEIDNLKIYQHLGFDTFIKSAQEIYPDGTVIDVDYYGMDLSRFVGESLCALPFLINFSKTSN